MNQIPATWRPLAAKVLCARSSTSVDTVVDLVLGDDPLFRVGAAEFARDFRGEIPALIPAAAILESYEDSTVRLACLPSETRWK